MITIFLAGDVMLGRGIDQILAHPGDPHLREDFVKSALDYLRLAERIHGRIPRGQTLQYVWGDAVSVLRQQQPDLGIVNLETAVTDTGRPEPKGINYRVAPRNIQGLGSLGVNCCVLANNHVLDWGREGLEQTLSTLRRLGISTSGAGRDRMEAAMPAAIHTPHGRVLVFGFAAADSGVPRHWCATPISSGVNWVDFADARSLEQIIDFVSRTKREGDVAIASIHWGSNWGYEIPDSHVDFAHRLIDIAGIDLVHGHSSHHPKGWEIHGGKLILYGCGDFVNDYEGITGYDHYRGDLALMYLPTIDVDRGGTLAALKVFPLQMRGFSLHHAGTEDVDWLCRMLNTQGRSTGLSFRQEGNHLALGRKADDPVFRRGHRPGGHLFSPI